ncbi:UDP:flavonoid glycosyltransferase YjiC (YdhE family) [Kitasatospora sp. MAA19]|uniref:nucleotide disphospho-sugar-binding domain-containing protein n=1 Tax=Kitasatospora sp. MAA19 TaxID=3035090 RepID=UPI00247603A4|nr:nucleotide disphospho-sugar-binding domain-containing protein [Kitasatospora sp. MAA19]MDH6710890.1 UDP:flavonoid glycosyltransferase YjiC (YdhE family) [Kitasatospora sp. MAA19]
MSKIIVAATPVAGHTGPLLRIAGHLSGLGHEVVFLGGARFAAQVAAEGCHFQALPAAADFDDRDFAASFPERELVPAGPARLSWDARHIFGDPVPAQLAALHELLASFPATVAIHDSLFLGGAALALGRKAGDRPAVVAIGTFPVMVGSRDTAPFGPGLPPPVDETERAQYAALAGQFAERGRLVTEYVRQCFAAAGVELPAGERPRVLTEAADHFLQLTVPGFEYPRSDLPANVRFIGALPIPASKGDRIPSWWPELEQARAQGRKVVVVTQGTVANGDLTALVVPTLRALAGREDLLVIAATARHDGELLLAAELPQLPANARAAGYVPFDALLPHADLLVSNGGYGGVHTALGHGVPLVIAAESEDKPEVAARVAWSGTGIDLRTGRPTTEDLAAAVDEALSRPSYRRRAEALCAELARHRAPAAIADLVAEIG